MGEVRSSSQPHLHVPALRTADRPSLEHPAGTTPPPAPDPRPLFGVTSAEVGAPRATDGFVRGRHQDPALRPFLARAAERLDIDPSFFELRWGRRPSGAIGWVTRTTRLASIRVRTGVVRVHPVLDDRLVPPEALEFLLYHELCHIVALPRRGANGTWSMHHAEFRALEHRHPHADSSEVWFRDHLCPTLQSRRIVESVGLSEALSLFRGKKAQPFREALQRAAEDDRAGRLLPLPRDGVPWR